MDIHFLESFIVVAECGSIAEAARRLNVSAATLAQRLRAVEKSLGYPLIERAGRTVHATVSGQAILPHVRKLVEAARDLSAIAACGVPAGQLRLGATASALTGLLPGIIAALNARYPKIDYFITPGSSISLYHQVIAGDLDGAIIVQPRFQIPKSVNWLTLRTEPLTLITPYPIKPDAAHTTITTQPFIRYDRNQWGGQLIDDYLRHHQLDIDEWLELDALDAIAVLVDKGLGVAIVPDWSPPWPAGLTLSKMTLKQATPRRTGLLWNRSGARIAAIQALVDICATHTNNQENEKNGKD